MLSNRRLFLFAVLCAWAQAQPSDPETQKMFEKFQERFHKDYAKENDDVPLRYKAFKENLQKAHDHNLKRGHNCTDLLDGDNITCVFGVTPFSDMFEVEFKTKMLGYKKSGKNHSLGFTPPEEYKAHLPRVGSFDWRSQGKVSPLKDQNPCGVCWAFSAAGTVESAVAIKNGGSPPILSPEQIVDCDGSGCQGGGDPSQAFDFLQQSGGLATESAYPTTCCNEGSGQVGSCQKQGGSVQITGSFQGPQNEESLAAAVQQKGPMSIIVSADDAWQQYRGGVFTGSCGQVDHAVAIVGFTPEYWIVRNQWGKRWGDQGYIYLAFGQDTSCVTTEASYPQVSGGSPGPPGPSPGPSPSPWPPSPSPPSPSPPGPSGCAAQCQSDAPGQCNCNCYCQCGSRCGDGCYDNCNGGGGCRSQCSGGFEGFVV